MGLDSSCLSSYTFDKPQYGEILGAEDTGGGPGSLEAGNLILSGQGHKDAWTDIALVPGRVKKESAVGCLLFFIRSFKAFCMKVYQSRLRQAVPKA